MKPKIAFFKFSKKFGDNGASVATFVATLDFTLDTAGLEESKNVNLHGFMYKLHAYLDSLFKKFNNLINLFWNLLKSSYRSSIVIKGFLNFLVEKYEKFYHEENDENEISFSFFLFKGLGRY